MSPHASRATTPAANWKGWTLVAVRHNGAHLAGTTGRVGLTRPETVPSAEAHCAARLVVSTVDLVQSGLAAKAWSSLRRARKPGDPECDRLDAPRARSNEVIVAGPTSGFLYESSQFLLVKKFVGFERQRISWVLYEVP